MKKEENRQQNKAKKTKRLFNSFILCTDTEQKQIHNLHNWPKKKTKKKKTPESVTERARAIKNKFLKIF